MSSPFPSFLNDLHEVSKSGKRLVGVVRVLTDLQHGAEDGMFGHPIRDALARAAIQWTMDRSPELSVT